MIPFTFAILLGGFGNPFDSGINVSGHGAQYSGRQRGRDRPEWWQKITVLMINSNRQLCGSVAPCAKPLGGAIDSALRHDQIGTESPRMTNLAHPSGRHGHMTRLTRSIAAQNSVVVRSD